MSLGNLTAKVGLDTGALSGEAAKAKAELSGVGASGTKLGTDVKAGASLARTELTKFSGEAKNAGAEAQAGFTKVAGTAKSAGAEISRLKDETTKVGSISSSATAEAQSGYTKVAASTKAATSETARLRDETAKVGGETAKSAEAVKHLAQVQGSSAQAAEKAALAQTGVTRALDASNAAAKNLAVSAGNAEKKLQGLGNSGGGVHTLTGLLEKLSTVGINIPSQFLTIAQGAEKAGDSVDKVGKAASSGADAMGKLGNAATVGGGALQVAEKDASVLSASLKGGLQAAAAVGAAALVSLAVKSMEKFQQVTAEVGKLKTTLGTTAEDASRLRNVAVGLGVDVAQLGKAVFTLGPTLTKTGGDLAGVHVEIAKNKDGTTDLFRTILNLRAGYQSLQDPIQKNTFLQEAFKKSGLDLRPILAANNELFKAAADRGPIITDKDISNAKAFAGAQRDIKQKVEDVEVTFAQKAIPAYEKADHAAFAVFQTAKAGFQVLIGQAPAAAGSIGKIGHAFDKQKESAGASRAKIDELAESTEKLRLANERLTAIQETSADKSIAAARAIEGITKADDALVTAQDKVLKAQDAINSEEVKADGFATKLTTAQHALAAATTKYGASSDQAATARQALTVLEQAGGEETNRLNEKLDNLKSAETGVKDALNAQFDARVMASKATRDAKVASQEAAGAQVDARAKAYLLIGALEDEAKTLAPGSPLRQQLEAYIVQLRQGIPPEARTKIEIDDEEAKAKLANIKRLITEANSNVTFQDTYDNVTGKGTPASTGPRPPSVLSEQATGGIVGRASGGIVAAAAGLRRGFKTNGPVTLVGEGNAAYPEFVIASDPMYRMRNLGLLGQAAQALGASGGGDGSAMNVNVSPAPVTIVLDGRAIASGTVQFMVDEMRSLQRSRA